MRKLDKSRILQKNLPFIKGKEINSLKNGGAGGDIQIGWKIYTTITNRIYF